MKRHYNGQVYHYEVRYGDKRDAKEHAEKLRAKGKKARVTKEQMEYGKYYVVWVR